MIYLDNHATTKIDPRVLKAMSDANEIYYVNSFSECPVSEKIEGEIFKAKKYISKLISSNPESIYFLPSATEANNIVIKSADVDLIITTNSEHSSINESLKKAKSNVIKLNVDNTGNINYIELLKVLKENKDVKKLVSIIYANNEIGTVHNIGFIGALCKKYNAVFHTDAAQALGKIDIGVKKDNIDILTMSAHKIYGPKGIGALYVRDDRVLTPIVDGGGQSVLSSGTQNVPAIIGFGVAAKICLDEPSHNRRLRDHLLKRLKEFFPDLIVNGTMIGRLSNNLNVSIPDFPSEILIKTQNELIISSGSACLGGQPSETIKTVCSEHYNCAIRFGIGRFNTIEEVDKAACIVYNKYKEIKNAKRDRPEKKRS